MHAGCHSLNDGTMCALDVLFGGKYASGSASNGTDCWKVFWIEDAGDVAPYQQKATPHQC